jgi:hypothetical protein
VEGIIMGHPRFTKEEIARRGQELYDRDIRAQVEADAANRGKIVVMDIETGEFSLNGDSLDTIHAMRARRPGAALYRVRVGYPAVHKIGGSWGVAGR